jgi:hypothetical protein
MVVTPHRLNSLLEADRLEYLLGKYVPLLADRLRHIGMRHFANVIGLAPGLIWNDYLADPSCCHQVPQALTRRCRARSRPPC